MNTDLISLLAVMAYLTLGTLAIALVGAWILKWFGPPK